MRFRQLKDIELHNGGARWAEGRTASSELGLSPEQAIRYLGQEYRQRGTGYYNVVYRVSGTNDMIVHRMNDGPIDNLYWSNIQLHKNYWGDPVVIDGILTKYAQLPVWQYGNRKYAKVRCIRYDGETVAVFKLTNGEGGAISVKTGKPVFIENEEKIQIAKELGRLLCGNLAQQISNYICGVFYREDASEMF